jgi:hypothetical protein
LYSEPENLRNHQQEHHPGGIGDRVKAEVALEFGVPQILPRRRLRLRHVGAVGDADWLHPGDDAVVVRLPGDRDEVLHIGDLGDRDRLEKPLAAQQRGEDAVHHQDVIGRVVHPRGAQGRQPVFGQPDIQPGLDPGVLFEHRDNLHAHELLERAAIGVDDERLRRPGDMGPPQACGRSRGCRAAQQRSPADHCHLKPPSARDCRYAE